ncbi:TPA: hypothetical protein NHL12_001142 [Pseudomonas aeruginosa]|nr:hypothetical protein [Pseudomonas aeruginosa]
MSDVTRYNFDTTACWYEHPDGEFVEHDAYAKLAAEAQALREEVAALRMARDDFKLERDLARQNFCDEQAANYQLQAHLKSCLGELAEPRARVVVVPERRPAPKGTWSDMGDAYNEGVNNTLDELARLNGLTVSEGLLRRISNLFPADMGDDGSGRAGWFPHVRETVAELRALLSEQE